MLSPGRSGLGFAVGNEPLTSVFANSGCRIVASDLDFERAQQSGWVSTNEHAKELASLNSRGICDDSLFAELVSFRVIDMNDIPPDLANFDFCWSACAIEHLGSIKRGLEFFENSMLTLRPGGIAIHTTELNCDLLATETIDNNATVVFTKQNFQDLGDKLRLAGHQVEFNFDLGDSELDRHIDMPPYSADSHLKLQLEGVATTSFGIIAIKSSKALGERKATYP